MTKGLYRRLAVQNIRKNGQFYFPYLLAGVFTVAMYFILYNLSVNDGIDAAKGGGAMITLLGYGRYVSGFLAVVILFYANSFLMKQRKTEFGLYSVLGLEKRHIARIMAWESLFSFLIVLAGGLLAGVVLNQLSFLILLNIARLKLAFGSVLSVSAAVSTALIFVLLFLLELAYNLFQVARSRPIDLLRAAHEGEREPRANWIVGLMGLVTLGAGYYIALTIQSPLQSLYAFFVAILLVMVGTYALFAAGSIGVLKLLRRNKAFYYQTRHFTAVSGLMYRMKQNAAGLASICILCTGVLLMLSSSTCLYMGIENVIGNRFYRDVSFYIDDASDEKAAQAQEILYDLAEQYQVTVTDLSAYRMENLYAADDIDLATGKTVSNSYSAMSADEYTRLTGQALSLEDGEILLVDASHDWEGDTFSFGEHTFQVVQVVNDLPVPWTDGEERRAEHVGADIHLYCIVLKDEAAVLELGFNSQTRPDYYCSFNLEGDRQNLIDYSIQIRTDVIGLGQSYVEARYESIESFFTLYGGMLFLGIFLGLLFLMATALIMYYKQISEGYEDRERFAILQQVGMGPKEVRQSIRSQILMVFFLPLGTAVIHMAAAFPITTKVLSLLNMSDTRLFLACLAGTVVAFALVYALVYHLTARSYYKIVSGAAA